MDAQCLDQGQFGLAHLRSAFSARNRAAVGILNGFGRSLGDSVIGLQALTVAIAAGTVERNPTLLRLPGLPAIICELYEAAHDIATMETLPWADEKPGSLPDVAARFSKVIDLRDFAFDPAFRGVAMIDFFLERLGLDPTLVAPTQKRNNWLAPRVRPDPRAFEMGYILVCPTASTTMRSMPVALHDAILKWLHANTTRQVLTQAMLPRETTLSGLCGLVANASLIISTDTAMVHLADAYSRPCLAFFNTHRPEWRARDYPLCQCIHLPAKLPTALEFSRGDDDDAEACAAWFPHGDGMAWLDNLLKETVNSID
jgi:hypothetical protein